MASEEWYSDDVGCRGYAIISASPTTAQRKLKADYYPLIVRAVAALPNDSAAVRADIYAKARQSLLRHLQALQPPLSDDEIAAELSALDQAIERVETPPSTTPAPAQPERRSEVPRALESGAETGPRRADKRPWTPVQKAAVPAYIASAVFWSILILGPMREPDMSYPVMIVAVVCYSFALTPLILSMVAAWYRRKRCRAAGLIKHRLPVFALRNAGDQARRETAADMSELDLIWCCVLPDHCLEAKDVIRQELLRRGYSQEAIDAWAPGAADVTVPCALERPMSVERYRSLVRFRMWAFRSYLVIIGILTGLLCVASVSMVFDGAASKIGPVAGIVGILMLMIAALASLPFRRRALRILLLRPFGEKKMTRALKHFVRKNAGRIGNVFTLSDRHYKPNLLITILWRLPAEGFDLLAIFLLGPLLGHSKRIASVKNERKFRKLERHLLRQYSPAFWSFMSGNQAFNIRSSDPWWQMCIHMLMHSCEVIIVDLSKVKEGTAWELDQLHAKDILDKCIFVVGENNVSDVQPVLERFFPDGQWPTVHVYGNSGRPADGSAYTARFDTVMSAGLAGWGR